MQTTQTTSAILLPVLAVAVPVIVAVITWALNERSKRLAEEYRRKEERYTALVSRIRAFSAERSDSAGRNEFVDQLNLAWLYCSDEVIRNAYAFLDSVHVQAPEVGAAREQRKRRALGEFMASIRRDLLRRRPLARTKLTAEDFKLLSSR